MLARIVTTFKPEASATGELEKKALDDSNLDNLLDKITRRQVNDIYDRNLHSQPALPGGHL